MKSFCKLVSPRVVLPVMMMVLSLSVHGQEGGLADLAPERAEGTVTPIAAAVRHLPELPEIPIEDSVFLVSVGEVELPSNEVPLPEIPRDAVTPAGLIAEQDQVFFNATLGGDSVNGILGSINVYRLGEGPQFRVGYDHSAADGFNLERPGTGFFLEENRLDAWLRLGGDDPLQLEVDGRYADQRFGLQQLSPYYSQDTREFLGEVRGRYVPETRFGLEGVLTYQDEQRVLSTGDSGQSPVRNAYRKVQPLLTATLEWPRFRAELRGRYSGAFPSDMGLSSTSIVDGRLSLEGVPLEGVTIGAHSSVLYRFDEGLFFPAEGYLSYRGDERWSIDLAGGYRVEENDPTRYWSSYPASDWEPDKSIEEERVPGTEVFFLDGEVGATVIPGVFNLRGSLGQTYYTQRLVPLPFDGGTQNYPYQLRSFTALDSELRGEFTITERVGFQAGWSASWEDRLPGEAAHTADAGLSAEMGDVSAAVNARIPVVETEVLPRVDLEIRYEMFRDVEMRFFANDILAPGLEEGRSLRNVTPGAEDPFIDTGFQLGAAVRVSF